MMIIINFYSTNLLGIKLSSVAHLVHLGLGKLIVQVQCKVHQQTTRWSGNLGRISESEKVSFQMVTERNYAIWWLNMFRGWIPKSRDSNWQSTSPSMSFNPLGTENNWKSDERRLNRKSKKMTRKCILIRVNISLWIFIKWSYVFRIFMATFRCMIDSKLAKYYLQKKKKMKWKISLRTL